MLKRLALRYWSSLQLFNSEVHFALRAGGEVSYFMKKETWKLVIQLIVSVLTAVATTLGVTSCM